MSDVGVDQVVSVLCGSFLKHRGTREHGGEEGGRRREGEGGESESWWRHEFCGTRIRSVTATALMKDWHRRGSNSQHVRVRGNDGNLSIQTKQVKIKIATGFGRRQSNATSTPLQAFNSEKSLQSLKELFPRCEMKKRQEW